MTTALPTLPAGPAAASCCAAAVGLDEPVRVRIIDVLRRSDVPVCQCELVPLFDIPQPTLSHHIKKLTDAGLVTVERRHRWAYYSPAPDAFQELNRWLS